MSIRRQNLLEAFKHSDAPPAAPASAPAGGLLGEAERQARRGSRPPVWLFVAIGLAFAFALGFLAGRGSPREARATEPAPSAPLTRPATQPRAFQKPPASAEPPASAKGAEGAAHPGSIEESALFDARNLYTVIVASYSKSNQDLAWATHEHLREAGLPVFPPVESRNMVLVLAGAAPTSDELAQTEKAVRALLREGKKAYDDAYRARIESLIPRTKTGTQKGP